jgi:hypothetical protein
MAKAFYRPLSAQNHCGVLQEKEKKAKIEIDIAEL